MPQPIDPHSELARVSQAERVQHIAERAALNAQLRATDDMAEQNRALEQQVRQMQQKDERVDEEARRRNPFVGRRKKRNRHSGDEAAHTFYDEHERKEVAEDEGDHNLDITI